MAVIKRIQDDYESMDIQFRHAPNRDLKERQLHNISFHFVQEIARGKVSEQDLKDTADYILTFVSER